MAGAGAEIRICASVKPSRKKYFRLRNTDGKTTMLHSILPLRQIWLHTPSPRQLEQVCVYLLRRRTKGKKKVREVGILAVLADKEMGEGSTDKEGH